MTTKPNPYVKPGTTSTLEQAANVWRRQGPAMDADARLGVLLKLAHKLFPHVKPRLQRKADGSVHIVIPKEGTTP